jgi:hypothetical protein
MHNTQCLIQPENDTRSTELPNEGATLYASDLRASALPPLLLAYASASASALDLPPLLEAEASADASADTIQRQIYVSAYGCDYMMRFTVQSAEQEGFDTSMFHLVVQD